MQDVLGYDLRVYDFVAIWLAGGSGRDSWKQHTEGLLSSAPGIAGAMELWVAVES